MMKTVLLVDDDPDQLTVFGALFEDEGMKVIAVGSATECLRVLAGQTVDCVVTDIAMPNFGGAELIRSIRAVSQIPIIAITAALEDREEAVLSAGADLFLLKKDLSRKIPASLLSLLD